MTESGDAMGERLQLSEKLARRDPAEAAHAARVTGLAVRLGAALNVEPGKLRSIQLGGPVHDIGKLTLDPQLLAKPGPLDERELDAIRTHPERGAELLAGDDLYAEIVDCVLYHHERWDGTGYPRGFGGAEIPLEARILAVADAYDAMTSTRPYRAPFTHDEAVAEVERCAGTQFDPRVASAFVALG